MSLDLHKLENKLDETLNNETSEELFKWLNYKRRELINSNKKYLEIPHRETIVSTNTLQTKPFDNQKIQIMENKKETAVIKEPNQTELLKAADDYGFQVPYDGTRGFYNRTKIDAFIDGAEWMRKKIIEGGNS
jgi:hypothetical protein